MFRTSYLIATLAVSSLLLTFPLAHGVATSIGLQGVAWNHNPTVFIKLQKGVSSSFKTIVINALNAWKTGLNTKAGATVFDYTLKDTLAKHQTADITITLKKNTGVILGSTSTTSFNGEILSVTINLATHNAIGLPLDNGDVFTIAAHEIGHAWGLLHSNDDGNSPLDLMSPVFDFTASNNVEIQPSDLDLCGVIAIYGTDGFGGSNPNPGGTSTTTSC